MSLRERTTQSNTDQSNKSESEQDERIISKSSKRFFSPFVLIPLLIRLLATIIYLCTVLPFFWIFTPLRILHPFLRRRGIPNGKLPLDLLSRLFTAVLLKIQGIEVSVEGIEKFPTGQASVVMYSHASNLGNIFFYIYELDPLILMSNCPIGIKFVFKKSLLLWAPYLMVLAWIYGHIPIDRANRQSAINSLIEAGKKIARFKRSVCISPEGTRSHNGKLQEFKKGPFHLSKSSDVAIVPVVLFNNFQLWPPGQLLPYSGEIRLRFLDTIKPLPEDTVDTLSQKVRESMLKGLQTDIPEIKERPETCINALLFLFVVFIFAYVIEMFWMY